MFFSFRISNITVEKVFIISRISLSLNQSKCIITYDEEKLNVIIVCYLTAIAFNNLEIR